MTTAAPSLSALLIPINISRATGSTLMRAAEWQPFIQAAALRYGITTPRRLALWLAQIGVESFALSRLEESLHYTAERLTVVWPTRFPSIEAARPFAGKPEALAERVYGGRMGNGPQGSGDGWRYRGRGLKQLTGRDNYAAYARATKAEGWDVLEQPDSLTTRPIAADSAAWFWHDKGCNRIADALELVVLTRAINGGLNGFKERQRLSKTALTAFGDTQGADSIKLQ